MLKQKQCHNKNCDRIWLLENTNVDQKQTVIKHKLFKKHKWWQNTKLKNLFRQNNLTTWQLDDILMASLSSPRSPEQKLTVDSNTYRTQNSKFKRLRIKLRKNNGHFFFFTENSIIIFGHTQIMLKQKSSHN